MMTATKLTTTAAQVPMRIQAAVLARRISTIRVICKVSFGPLTIPILFSLWSPFFPLGDALASFQVLSPEKESGRCEQNESESPYAQ